MDAYWAAPPVIRTLTAAVVVTSVAVRAGLVSAQRVVLWWPYIFRKFPPQVWRLITSFLITGPGLDMIFDPYFLYLYGSSLETESPRFTRKGDFFIYVVFLQVLILAICGGILGGFTFIAPLILGFAYTYSQDNPTRKVSFFIITFQAKYLPFAMLALTWVMHGNQSAYSQSTGLVAAHMYDFLTRIWPTFGGGKNLVQTPAIVRGWFGGDRPNAQVRGYGTAFVPGIATPQSRSGNSSAWTSSFSSWGGRGSGRRLGGD